MQTNEVITQISPDLRDALTLALRALAREALTSGVSEGGYHLRLQAHDLIESQLHALRVISE